MNTYTRAEFDNAVQALVPEWTYKGIVAGKFNVDEQCIVVAKLYFMSAGADMKDEDALLVVRTTMANLLEYGEHRLQ